MMLIKGKYILALDDQMNCIENGAVAVEDKKIVAICTEDEAKEYSDAEIIDCGHSIIMPGFVNTHTHAAMVYFRGLADNAPLDKWLNEHIWPAETKNVDPLFIKKASQLACLEMIKAGITCFNDMYFYPEITAGVCRQAGIRACLGEPLLNFPVPGRKSHKESLKKTDELAREFKKDELIKISLTPHATLTAGENILLLAKEKADELGSVLHIHVCETKKEAEDIKKQKGMPAAEYLRKIGLLGSNVISAHSVWLNDEEIAIYKEKDVSVNHNPISNFKLACGLMPIEKMIESRINISLGTDGAASNNTLDLFSEMRMAALVHRGTDVKTYFLASGDIVKMATKNGAKALNMNSGSLESGKAADIISVGLDRPHLLPVFDPYSHLVYCANSADVDNVIINGQVVMRNRQLTTMDEEKIIGEAKDFSRKIIR